MEQYARVKFDGSMKLALAGSTDSAVGRLSRATLAADEKVSIMTHHEDATKIVVAAAAFAAGAALYAAASGRVDDSGTLALNMIAITAATGAGQHVEAIDIDAV